MKQKKFEIRPIVEFKESTPALLANVMGGVAAKVACGEYKCKSFTCTPHDDTCTKFSCGIYGNNDRVCPDKFLGCQTKGT